VVSDATLFQYLRTRIYNTLPLTNDPI
jgi:hypothetical protein